MVDYNYHVEATENKTLCEDCSKCCEYFAMQIDTPETEEDFQNIRWYLLHKNVRVFVSEADSEEDEESSLEEESGDEDDVEEEWYIQIFNPCKKLTPEGLCSIHDARPDICRTHSQENCEKYGEEDDEIASFKDGEEFWGWALERYDFVEEDDETEDFEESEPEIKETFKNEDNL